MELRNTLAEIESLLEALKNRRGQTHERISDLDDYLKIHSQREIKLRKGMKIEDLQYIENYLKRQNLRKLVFKRELSKSEAESLFKNIDRKFSQTWEIYKYPGTRRSEKATQIWSDLKAHTNQTLKCQGNEKVL